MGRLVLLWILLCTGLETLALQSKIELLKQPGHFAALRQRILCLHQSMVSHSRHCKKLGAKSVEDLPVLNSFFQKPEEEKVQTKSLKEWIQKNISEYHPMVLVTHQVNITALTGIFPQEGEIIVLNLLPTGEIERIKE